MITKKQELRAYVRTFMRGGHNYRGEMVYDALTFAYTAHGDQTRQYSGEPYLYHPIEVMQILEYSAMGSIEKSVLERMLTAAVLHDVVEDTSVTLEEIDKQFGTVVSKWVDGLTAPSRKEDGDRAARAAIDREHLAACNGYVQTIKCADIASNARSIVDANKSFAPVYLNEKQAQLVVCTKAFGTTRTIAQAVVNEGLCRLSAG